MSNWQKHPHIRSGKALTFGERAADKMRNGMGSWTFVLASLAFLALWMNYNRGNGFDPYPFILLNLVLSCLAAMQGAILLIAAKRADQISSELALHTFAVDQESLKLTKQIAKLTLEVHRLTVAISGHIGVEAVAADGEPTAAKKQVASSTQSPGGPAAS